MKVSCGVPCLLRFLCFSQLRFGGSPQMSLVGPAGIVVGRRLTGQEAMASIAYGCSRGVSGAAL